MEKTIKLTKEQCTAISSYIENNGIEIYIDYRDELSSEQVQKILDGKGDDVRWEIEENCFSDEVPDYYWDDLREEVGITEEQLELWRESEDAFWPSWYLDDHGWNQLINNTTVQITGIMWQNDWNFNNWAYGAPIYYSDVKESLKTLGINPKEFHDNIKGGSQTAGEGKLKGWFPDMPDRKPVVELQELFDNMCVLYDGVMTFCFGDLSEVMEVMNSNSKEVVIRKGTNIVMYDFGGGAGITEAPLKEDLVVKRKDIEFRNDTDFRYGVQACYGFTQSYWNEGSVQSK